MLPEEYKKLTGKMALGRKAIAQCDLGPGIRDGDEVEITAKKDGFSVKGEACAACGVEPVATGVPPLFLELVPEEEK